MAAVQATRLAGFSRRSRLLGRAGARRALALAAAGAVLTPGLVRADSNWVPTDSNTYSWADPTTWDTNPTIPTNVGDVANINNSINGPQTINLDGSKTVGTLNLGSTGNAITIAAGSGGSLIFDNTTSPAALNLGGQAANIISSNVTLTDPLLLTVNDTGGLTFSGVVSGAGSLTRAGAGAGVVTLSGADTYTGGTIVSAGVLRATVAGAMGTGNATLTLSGGTLQLGSDTATNFGRNTTVTATSTIVSDRATAGAGVTHTLGALSIGAATLNIIRGANATSGTGGVTFVTSTTLTGAATFAPAANTTLTLAAVGESGGSQGLTVNGGGTLVLTGAGAYTGVTTITGGVVQINNATAFGTTQTNIALDRTGTAKRILIAGGLTTTYNYDIGLTGALTTVPGASGTGLLQQTGTGQAKINGIVTLGANGSAGGTFVGGTAVGNELVINGPINSSVANLGFSHRDGRVIYAGGGTATGPMSVTNTVIIGATNGLPVGLIPQLGGSGNATLDLALLGFNQRLAGLQLGNPAGAGTNGNSASTVNLGAKTLTLDGDITSLTTAAGSATHNINANPGGTIAFTAAAPNIVVPDSLQADDVVITGATISGAGGFSKTGAGVLSLRNVTVTGPVSVTAGTIAASGSGTTGSLTANGLNFSSGTFARFNLSSSASDVMNGGAVTSTGATININQFGGNLQNGTYPLITYTGTSPGQSNFTLAPLPGRLTGMLVDTGTAIAFQATGNDTLKWTGNGGGSWDINGTQSWKLNTAGTDTTYLEGDDVTFDDTGVNTAGITGSGTVSPSKVTFANTTAVDYSFSNFSIGGTASINKTGNGNVTLPTTNTYGGATTVAGGTLIITNGASIGSGVAGNSINLSGGGRIQDTAAAAFDYGVNRNIAVGAGGGSLSHNSATAAAITISGNITGSGPLSFHSANTAAGTFILTGTNSGYTGDISVDAGSTGLTALRIGAQSGAPGGGSITLNFPANSTTNGAATTLDLPGTAVPAAVTLNLTSKVNGATSLRTQVTSSGTAAINGPITVSGNAITQFTPSAGTLSINGNVSAGTGGFTGTFFVRGAGAGIVNGVINLPNGVFAKTDGGVWTINSTGSVYTLAQVVSSGSVKLGATNALAIGASLSIGQGSDAAASLLDMNGFSQQIAGLTWIAGTANSARAVGNTNATQSTLTINDSAAFSYGSTTGITGGLITGNIKLVKTGSGTQTLNGADTYTGQTNVNGGTLLETATHTGAGTYSVAGGTLGGTGSITLTAGATNQVLVQAGGILAPGTTGTTGILNILNATPGTGAASTVSLTAGGTLSVDLNNTTPGTGHDQVNVTGTVSVAGANLQTNINTAANPGDTYFIVKNDGTDAVNGTFATLNGAPLSGPDGNGLYTAANGAMLSYTADSTTGLLTGGNDIAVVAPEPASLGLIGLAAAGLLVRRRRRRT